MFPGGFCSSWKFIQLGWSLGVDVGKVTRPQLCVCGSRFGFCLDSKGKYHPGLPCWTQCLSIAHAPGAVLSLRSTKVKVQLWHRDSRWPWFLWPDGIKRKDGTNTDPCSVYTYYLFISNTEKERNYHCSWRFLKVAAMLVVLTASTVMSHSGEWYWQW